MTNIFPSSLTTNNPPALPSQDQKALFTKLSYMERENKALTKKVTELQAKNGLNDEVLDALLDKYEVSNESSAAVVSLLRQKTV